MQIHDEYVAEPMKLIRWKSPTGEGLGLQALVALDAAAAILFQEETARSDTTHGDIVRAARGPAEIAQRRIVLAEFIEGCPGKSKSSTLFAAFGAACLTVVGEHTVGKGKVDIMDYLHGRETSERVALGRADRHDVPQRNPTVVEGVNRR
jgi:hypothetical protein